MNWNNFTKRRNLCSPSPEPEYKVCRFSFADVEAPVLIEESFWRETVRVGEDIWIASQTPSG